MKRKLLALLIALTLLPLAFAHAAPAYEVTLPEGYEDSGLRYPVIYLLPQDGYAADDSGLEALLAKYGMDMIIVRPVFTAEDDPVAVMREVVAEADSAYRTVASPECRIAAGTGTGGYLAYILLLAEETPFGAAASIRGNFTGEDNPWLSACGSVKEKMNAAHTADEKAFDAFYTYMDAPLEDAWTDLPGSTDDLGSLMITYGTGSAFHEFTVRPGAFDGAFLEESASRLMDRLTARILSGVAVGSVAADKTTLSEAGEAVTLTYAVTVNDGISAFGEGELSMDVTVALKDGKEAAEATQTLTVSGPGEYTGDAALSIVSDSESLSAVLSVRLMGYETELASIPLLQVQPPVIDGGYQELSLMGDWYFRYTGAQETLDATALTKDDFSGWDVVQPCLKSWEKGFGNISDENVTSGYGPDYFNFFITGNGYYAKVFTVPESFDAQDLVLCAGYVDDRCEVFLNGVRVGATGMDEHGAPTGETTWAVFSAFDLDPAALNLGGENIMIVRAWNDLPFGAGGWYAGPVGLFSREAFDVKYAEGSDRFFEETFESAYAAEANGVEGTVENQYLIYLPDGYFSSDRYYPTVYLLHQFNSDHTSYRTDHVDQLLDEGIAKGLFDEMIVVIPNSSEESWWRGPWEKMITEELIPLIESEYRAIPDARYRLTAGCSMGGQGAYAVALRNPDYFTGVISFFGAFSYGGESNPVSIAAKEPAEYLSSYALYFVCGNQDSYGFGAPAIALHQRLSGLGVEHRFFIENGGHDSVFYVPFFQDAFSYVRGRMYHSDAASEALFTGNLTQADGVLKAELTADAAAADLIYQVPASSYTLDREAVLYLPLTVELSRDGEVSETVTRTVALTAQALSVTAEFESANLEPGVTVTLKAALFDRVITLATLEIE